VHRLISTPVSTVSLQVLFVYCLMSIFSCVLDLQLCFNFDTKNYKIFHGSIEAQFGYTVQQHELLTGHPLCKSANNATECIKKQTLECLSGVSVAERCPHLNRIELLYSSQQGNYFAVTAAFQRGGRPGAQKVMIVITDGESHDSHQLMEVVNQSKKENITMYAIAVLGYYNRRGINPEAFLKEIKFIASDPDEEHFFKVTDESALKDIVDALGERIFSLEGNSQGKGFGLQMAQAGFSSHVVNDGVLLGAVGAYDWNGAVLKETKRGKVVSPKSSYKDEFPEALKNHAAYLGYSVDAVTSSRGSQLYIAGAPRFNHTGKVIIFTLKNNGNLTILQALLGQQIGSYFGSGLLSMDIDGNGYTDFLLVAAPMYYNQGWERGRVYIYALSSEVQAFFTFHGVLEVPHHSQNSRLGSALAQIADMNGDGYKELVVGAPLEDHHQGAIYIFHSQNKMIGPYYKQRISAAGFSAGLLYFGQSLHGVLDVNGDGLVDLAVGALGAAVIIWSRGVVRIEAKMTFEPEKINIFNKNCQRGGKEVTCMSVVVCLRLDTVWYSLVFDERRFSPWAVLDESFRQQPRTLLLHTGNQECERLVFSVQDITDYRWPIVVAVEAGLQSQVKGPVLDPDWPTTLRTELPFWNGCEEDTCTPDLVLHSHTDLLNVLQFCSTRKHATSSLCSHRKEPEEKMFVVETGRRKMIVFAELQNQGENAFRTSLDISTTPNLLFSSLLVKDQSDIQIECSTENRMASQRSCNISAPFMRSLSQLISNVLKCFHVLISEGEDGYPDDNTNNIILPLKYQADLLFTRWVQNLGIFFVKDIILEADIWAVTKEGNQLVDITDYSIEEGTNSSCMIPLIKTTSLSKPEDLTHLSQLNSSNSVSIPLHCMLSLSPSKALKLTFRGRLQLPTLQAVSYHVCFTLIKLKLVHCLLRQNKLMEISCQPGSC
uniref:VWFA domain-containing protein n=1 Tax=Xiphophorus couchianus TaxID=32473 RepID=A0A3B5L7C6_9TELE